MVRIAVEYPFTDIQRALVEEGYQTDMLEQKSKADMYDVLVVRDIEIYEDFHFEGSLIEVRGMTVSEVVAEVEERLQRIGKIPGKPQAVKNENGGGFFAGFVSGAVIGSAAVLLLAPKSGKEFQATIKGKLSNNSAGDAEGGKLGTMKDQPKEPTSFSTEETSYAPTQIHGNLPESTANNDNLTTSYTNARSSSSNKEQ